MDKYMHFIFKLMLSCLPALIALYLVSIILGHSIYDFHPTLNDQLAHYMQSLAFSVKGLDAGYFSIKGAEPYFLYFGPHGPFYAITYGMFFNIIGNELYSPFFINLILITISTMYMVFYLKKEYSRTTLIILVLLISPLSFMIASNMQMTLHVSISIILAVMFSDLLKGNKYILKYLFLLLIYASLVRYSWSIFFILVYFVYIYRFGKPLQLKYFLLTSILPLIFMVIHKIFSGGENTNSITLDNLYDNILRFSRVFFNLNYEYTFIQTYLLILLFSIIYILVYKLFGKDNSNKLVLFIILINLLVVFFSNIIIQESIL